MPTTIDADRMTSDATDVVATLVDPAAGLWTVTGRHGLYTYNQAITAMTIAELRARRIPRPNDALAIATFEQELLVPPMPRDPWALLQTLKAAASAVRSLPHDEQFAAPPFGGNIAECLLRIGEAAVDIAAGVDALADLAAERGDDTDIRAWYRVENRADDGMKHLQAAGRDLHDGGMSAQTAQREGKWKRR